MWFTTLKHYYRLRYCSRKLKLRTIVIRRKMKQKITKRTAIPKFSINYLIIVLLILAVWQLGQGGYIYAKALFAQYLIETAWQKTLGGDQQVRPWSWADTWPVAKLTSRKYHTKLFILAGDNGRTLAFGPGYRFGSELPGDFGNSIVSGHRDTHFYFLRDVKLFDKFEIQKRDGTIVNYRVTNIKVVSIENDFVIERNTLSTLTLVTCYPFDSIITGGKLRYIVTAQKVEKPVISAFITEQHPELSF